MSIPFYKMHGTGNDFIIVNNQQLKLSQEELSTLAKKVCETHFSVGSDALMAVDYAETSGDFRMRFFNSDGSEAEMCGNGARCLARYAYEEKLATQEMVIETIAGNVFAHRLSDRVYKVKLNNPANVRIDCEVPFALELKIDYVELGNPGVPHLVVHYPNLQETSLEELRPLAKQLRSWDKLPKGANVNFYDETDKIILRTFERGVEDFTLACGTGAGSTAYILSQRGISQSQPISLYVPGGLLQVEVKGQELALIGQTSIVVKGSIFDEDFF